MINRTQFYFCTENHTGNIYDNIEEVMQEAREYLKNKTEYCFIFRKEFWAAFDNGGNLLYKSNSEYREFDAELKVNNFVLTFNQEENSNVADNKNES